MRMSVFFIHNVEIFQFLPQQQNKINFCGAKVIYDFIVVF